MSEKDSARRTSVEVFFDGADISKSLRPYFLSLTYTDNEEDESDDLQIRIEDRDDVWLCQWLNDAIEAAASTGAPSGASTPSASAYKVTAKSGLNVRSGPGTSYKKLGALAYGATLSVGEIANGWAATTYSGKSAYVSANYIAKTDAGSVSPTGSTSATGLKIQAAILRENWHGDGKDKLMECGQFELDAVDVSGPPSTITLKATSLPYSSTIRQTKKSKAWEAYTLSGLSGEIAKANGMTCLYESATNPTYTRVEQYKTSDIDFLSTLCHNAGISLKATNNILVLFDQAAYEKKASSLTLTRGGGSYTKYKLSSGQADKQYASCRVSYTNPSDGKTIESTVYVDDYKEKSKNNQQLEVPAKVASVAEAKTLAEKRLRLCNKYAKTASFTMPGNPDIVAGMTVNLKGWGAFDGQYIISQSRHTVGGSGYTVQISLRKALGGY